MAVGPALDGTSLAVEQLADPGKTLDGSMNSLKPTPMRTMGDTPLDPSTGRMRRTSGAAVSARPSTGSPMSPGRPRRHRRRCNDDSPVGCQGVEVTGEVDLTVEATVVHVSGHRRRDRWSILPQTRNLRRVQDVSAVPIAG